MEGNVKVQRITWPRHLIREWTTEERGTKSMGWTLGEGGEEEDPGANGFQEELRCPNIVRWEYKAKDWEKWANMSK